MPKRKNRREGNVNEYEVGISYGTGTILAIRADLWENDDGCLRFLKRDEVSDGMTPLYTKVCEVSSAWWLWVRQVNSVD